MSASSTPDKLSVPAITQDPLVQGGVSVVDEPAPNDGTSEDTRQQVLSQAGGGDAIHETPRSPDSETHAPDIPLNSTLPSKEALLAKLKDFFKDSFKAPSIEEKTKAWADTTKIVEDYSEELVDQWNKEIDSLLTFAGLFSAILTAFNVQSYQLLQPTPTDETNAVLKQISAQLASFSVNPPSVNSTQPAFISLPPPLPFRPQPYAIWLNCLWFASLVFSLSSAAIGIIVKQWLKEYSTGLYGSSREIARRRQYRLNNLVKWRVGTIVALISILLHIAAILFLAGLVIFVHNINATVAIVVSTLVGILFAFQLVTTILPGIFMGCAYRSPQAYYAFLVVKPLTYVLSHTAFWLTAVVICTPVACLVGTLDYFSRFSDCHRIWMEAIGSLLFTIRLSWTPLVWGREEQVDATERTSALDADIMFTAYTASRDASCLDKASICITDFSQPEDASQYVAGFHTRITSHWGDHCPPDTAVLFGRLAGCATEHISTLSPDLNMRNSLKYRIRKQLEKSDIDILSQQRASFARSMLEKLSTDLDQPWEVRKRAMMYVPFVGCLCTAEVSALVATAMAYKIAVFAESRYRDPQIVKDDVLSTYAGHLLRAANSLADVVPDAASKDALQVASHAVTYILDSLREFLTTPEWQVECRNGKKKASDLWDLTNAASRLSDHDHTRALVTEDLVCALEKVREDCLHSPRTTKLERSELDRYVKWRLVELRARSLSNRPNV